MSAKGDRPTGIDNSPEKEPVVNESRIELGKEENLPLSQESEKSAETTGDGSDDNAVQMKELTNQVEAGGETRSPQALEQTEKIEECIPLAKLPTSQSESQGDDRQPTAAIATENSDSEETPSEV